MIRAFAKRFVSGSVVLCICLTASASLQAEDAADYAKVIEQVTPAFVTVKFVLKMDGQFGKRESEAEITGVMIDPAGLVLCGNTRLGSPRMMRSIGGSATPTDMKVLIGDDTDGLEAKVLVRDSELDLAWVKIKKPGDRKFAYVDLARAATPIVGQRLLAIRKMAKYFDRAMTFSEGRLSGKTRKPRELLVPTGTMTLEAGLPVFSTTGEIVGIVVVQMPEDDELQSMALTGIGRDISNGLILPAAEVAKATARAKEAKEDDGKDEDNKSKSKKAKNAEGKSGDEKPASDDDDDE